jgi:heptosyltransferase-3
VKLDPQRVKRIALVRIGKIGDLIVTNFAIRKVRATFPSALILLVTLPRNRKLLQYSKDVDRIRFFHKSVDILPLLLTLRHFHADLLLDFNDNPSSTSALIARYSGSMLKVGFEFPNNRSFLSVGVECPVKEHSHITQRLRKIPEAIGIRFEESEIVPSMTLGEREASDVSRHLATIRRSSGLLIAVNVSAGDPGRYWPVDRWKQLLSAISVENQTAQFILLCAPGDENITAEAGSVLPSSRVLFPAHRTFHHFAAYIAKSQLLLSPDTAAVHIASAFGVPVVGLYPAVEWNFQSWRPIGTLYEAIRPREGLVSEIAVGEVIDAYHRLTDLIKDG